MLITYENMSQYSIIPIEYRLVDTVEVEPGVKAHGIKLVSSLDWFFKFHFPEDPIMPAVFMMESVQQTGMLIVTTLPDVDVRLLHMNACKSMRVFHEVRPGDILDIYVTLERYKYGKADLKGEIRKRSEGDESLLCFSMEYTIINQKQISNYMNRRNEK